MVAKKRLVERHISWIAHTPFLYGILLTQGAITDNVVDAFVNASNALLILGSAVAGKYLGVHHHGGTIICNDECDSWSESDLSRGNIVLNDLVNLLLPGFKNEEESKSAKVSGGARNQIF